jgi:putative PIN family toxin of toxin-antitoxin system
LIPRVVLDTSVLVSAIVSDGKSRDLMRGGIDGQFSMVESDQILKELVSVLRRPKFGTSEEEIDRIILALRGTAEVVEVIGSLMAP